MIFNIRDRRTNQSNVDCEAIFEPSCHDNCVAGATQAKYYGRFSYERLPKTTVQDAMRYANMNWPDGDVTMFLYDIGTNERGT